MKFNIAMYCANWWAHKKFSLKYRFGRSVLGIFLNRAAFRLRMIRVSKTKDEFHPSLSLWMNLIGCPSKEEEERRIREIMRLRQRAHERDLAAHPLV